MLRGYFSIQHVSTGTCNSPPLPLRPLFPAHQYSPAVGTKTTTACLPRSDNYPANGIWFQWQSLRRKVTALYQLMTESPWGPWNCLRIPIFRDSRPCSFRYALTHTQFLCLLRSETSSFIIRIIQVIIFLTVFFFNEYIKDLLFNFNFSVG